jgi:hypothetical protein
MVLRATLLSLLLAAGCRRESPAPAAPSCLDAQLAAKGLNQYGDPPGTMYTGGTPLFDEKTGVSTAREQYVYAKHPDIARACAAP